MPPLSDAGRVWAGTFQYTEYSGRVGSRMWRRDRTFGGSTAGGPALATVFVRESHCHAHIHSDSIDIDR